MLFKRGLRWLCVFGIVLNVCVSNANGQAVPTYTNSWIVYGKPYVKIGITQKGIHKLPLSLLPKDFPVGNLDKLQLWHRGKQVAIISTTDSQVTFYAVPNDGARDSLLYRPMSSRINPFWSMYSDESAYFLTAGDANGLRAEKQNIALNTGMTATTVHNAVDNFIYKTEYSLSTNNYLRPTFFNSFFEIGASRTGKISLDGKATNYTFQLVNYVEDAAARPKVKLLVHGRSNGSKNIEVYVGKTAQTLRLVKAIANDGFEANEYSFELTKDDIDAQNKGVLSFKAVGTNAVDAYSVAYYSLYYNQQLDMSGKTTMEIQLPGSTAKSERITLKNAPANATILAISDTDVPVAVGGQAADFMFSRKTSQAQKLLVTTDFVTVQQAKVTAVDFSAKYPVNSEFIIVTSENLLDGANQYANYRMSKDGGGFKTLVANIKDIYNQFNYGEPSPLAIRSFNEYMVSGGATNKYLFLVGKSITFNERMVRELPNEVPTIGFPASDILLVEGLGGARKEVPAFPVGRLSVVSSQSVLDYLQKVKDYEHNAAGNYGWRKNVLHLNGGKTAGEITQLKDMLAALEPKVSAGIIGGKVTPFVKQQAISEVETVNITPQVNNGIGLLTYFGHGSTVVTDLDMGYITDANRGYNNPNMYPMMYFNGCGVGNIFSARFNPVSTASDRYPLSIDWLITPKKGAVAIIANSFESFVSPSERYLDQLYTNMFLDSTSYNLSIGKIQIAVANKILAEDAGAYNVQNIHQSLLQGDPSLKLVSVSLPDYAVNADDGIKLYAETPEKTIGTSANIKIGVRIDNLGRYVKTDKVPVDITFVYDNTSEVSKETISGFAFHDTITVAKPGGKVIQQIEVRVDPGNTIQELNKANNKADLTVDWGIASNESVYPQGTVVDVVPPFLDVKFNNRNIRNFETVSVSPEIKITLQDDRFLNDDTTNVTVYLKSCWDNNCEFEKVSIANSSPVSTVVSDRVWSLDLKPGNLNKAGSYELLVNSRDVAGNAPVLPYRIAFKISDQAESLKVIASPNPASTYLRFETFIGDGSDVQAIDWTIYDMHGRILENKKISPPTRGVSEWYWRPAFVPAGLYFYKVNFIGANESNLQSLTGKVALIN